MLVLITVLSPLIAVIVFTLVATRNCPASCPDCNSSISRFQSPITKTKRQWIHGGFRCTNCDCQLDIRGNIVESEQTAPASFVAWIGLITLAAIVALAWLLPVSF